MITLVLKENEGERSLLVTMLMKLSMMLIVFEKNRDLLHSDLLQVLFTSYYELPRLFASNIAKEAQDLTSPLWRTNGLESRRLTLATKFKGQLFKLLQHVENTSPHFIQCIKPNRLQLPGVFEQDLVLQQICSCALLEVVRISRSGYPTRMPHEQFAEEALQPEMTVIVSYRFPKPFTSCRCKIESRGK